MGCKREGGEEEGHRIASDGTNRSFCDVPIKRYAILRVCELLLMTTTVIIIIIMKINYK